MRPRRNVVAKTGLLVRSGLLVAERPITPASPFPLDAHMVRPRNTLHTVAKHHGLPTRLLDWTHSPFVAMHFCTADIGRFDADGAIWVVDYVKAQELLPEELRAQLAKEGSNMFTGEMLSRVADSLEDLKGMHPPNFVGFFESPSMDERIVNQYALLSFMSDAGAMLDQWLEERPGLWKKIVIPAELKWEIRDTLDQVNVTERVLFPGLDGLSSWLKRHYMPKEREAN
jgi:FRG domain